MISNDYRSIMRESLALLINKEKLGSCESRKEVTSK